MPSRFVILHHQLDDGEHWDLMVEWGKGLATWQLAREPVNRGSLPIPARRIANHRKAYLEYEGPLSRDRGRVRRVDQGTVTIEELTGGRWVFELTGSRLAGRFVLAREADDRWTLSPA